MSGESTSIGDWLNVLMTCVRSYAYNRPDNMSEVAKAINAGTSLP